MRRILSFGLALIVIFSFGMPGRTQEINFSEEFALAKDRAKVLQSLIPGSEDYYFYNALHHINTQQFDKAAELLPPWLKAFGETERYRDIQLRHALMTYERNPNKAYEILSRRLNPNFSHQKQIAGSIPNLPTALNPTLIARDTLTKRAWSSGSMINGFEPSSFDWLTAENFTDYNVRRQLLSRLTRSDVPNVVKLIVDDLNAQYPVPFGQHPIHSVLTTKQLDELQAMKPDLAGNGHFVNLRLLRLQPGADDNWRTDPTKTKAYLDRLLAYAKTLSPVHNSLKAHALNHRLTFDRSRGTFDKALFLEYLALPRGQPYMKRTILESATQRDYPARLDAQYTQFTQFPAVINDEPLVRSLLKDIFKTAESYREFEPFIETDYLRKLFAETKIEQGLGEPERWAAQLSPAEYAALKDRIDIDFLPTNPTHFGANDDVRLTLGLKNVPTLIVNIFEINTANYYQTNLRDVGTDLNLDGLIANSKRVENLTEPPSRRIEKTFTFPELKKPGVYVIDFIGNGSSSRALVRKGKLRPLVRPSAAGLAVNVVDDTNTPVPDAVIWMGGKDYPAEKDGVITIPFSSSPGRQPIVIRQGDFACLDEITTPGETYQLTAGIHIDREALLSQRLATIAVRPSLKINNSPVSISLLEEPKLTMTAVDHEGVRTTTTIKIEKLFEDRESTHTFRVPPRLATLNVRLEATVKSVTTLQSVTFATEENFAVNAIAKTDIIEDVHLARYGKNYVLEVRGRTGEPKADRAYRVQVKHRDFTQPVIADLKTDAAGRIMLGELTDITSVTATSVEGRPGHLWSLPTDRFTYRQVMHIANGDTLTLPYLGTQKEASRLEFALTRVIGSTVIDDDFARIKLADGTIQIAGLTPGDYTLLLKPTNERILIRVADGPKQNGFVLSPTRQLELPKLAPTRVTNLTNENDGSVTLRFADVSKLTRVHVYASRFAPSTLAFNQFAKIRDVELRGVENGSNESSFLTGRNIGDEYRYVLDRRLQKPFAGNMLERPQLLLNPWAVRETTSGEQLATEGGAFGRVADPKAAAPLAQPPAGDSAGGRGAGPTSAASFADLDFLADPAVSLINLTPDADGKLVLRKDAFGSKSWVTIVVVDPLHTMVKTVHLAEPAFEILDLRLRNGLDPKAHFTQQKQVSILEAGKPFVIRDAAGSRFDTYDSLAKMHSLFATLTGDPRMGEFSFVLNWPKLKDEEKRTLYSKHACHELNYFVFSKDRVFFDAVVKPYLANKKDKTFLDHYLLGNDLKPFTQPWEYRRLNTVEKILLGRVLPNETAKTARYLADLLKLAPPNPERDSSLFEFAVKGSDFERSQTTAGLKVQELEKLRMPSGGVGGFGGGGFAGGMPGVPGNAPSSGALGAVMPQKAPPSGGGGRPNASPPPALARDAADMNKLRKELQSKGGEMAKDAKSKGELQDQLKKAEEMPEDKPAFAGEAFFEADRRKRDAQILYRKVDPTSEWAESNYHKLPIQKHMAELVRENAFWLDYANHTGPGPFLSKHFNQAGGNFTEAMFALAVTNLPFEAPKHETKFDAGAMTFTPGGPVIAFHEEVKPGGDVQANLPILVSQNVYKANDRFRDENGEKLDKFVTDEFVVHTVYGMQVVVTNPSSSRQRLAVLIQIPQGALPLGGARPTQTKLLDLEPYRTATIDTLFYFPAPGTFEMFPVHVAKNEKPVAAAKLISLKVVAKSTKQDPTSWDYVSQNGTTEEVIAYLTRENVHGLNLDLIAWRLSDAEAFDRIITVLNDRHAFDDTLWAYSLKHRRVKAVSDYLKHVSLGMIAGINSPIYQYDPVASFDYQHLEYKPLVNARAYALGKRRQIVNAVVYQQYNEFLEKLLFRPTLSDDDHLAVAYYLLLQDRVDEAAAHYAQVNPEKIATRLQYDSFSAYLAMSREDFATARAVAMKHANHPVDRWRFTFKTVLDTLDEAEGKGPAVADVQNRQLMQAQAAANEQSFQMTLEKQTIGLTTQNLKNVTVNYYLMDVELLFSRNPFVQQTGGQFSTVKPNGSAVVNLEAGKTTHTIPLPAEYKNKNVLVEVVAGGKRQSLPSYANAMTVTTIENFGQVKVVNTATGKPLAKVYVKTYVRTQDGQVKFHKDGYTDVRGRFDYATVSTPERSGPARYAVLVLSDEHGAVIRDVAPPQQ